MKIPANARIFFVLLVNRIHAFPVYLVIYTFVEMSKLLSIMM